MPQLVYQGRSHAPYPPSPDLRQHRLGIALFVALGGGTAVALSGSNTVFTDDIANDTQPASGGNPAGGLQAADLRPGSVGTSEVANGALNDEDIGHFSAVDVQVDIGTVAANDCAYVTLDLGPGAPTGHDHILLTPDFSTTAFDLDYGIQYTGGPPKIAVCNPTNSAIFDGITEFNALFIDDQ